MIANRATTPPHTYEGLVWVTQLRVIKREGASAAMINNNKKKVMKFKYRAVAISGTRCSNIATQLRQTGKGNIYNIVHSKQKRFDN